MHPPSTLRAAFEQYKACKDACSLSGDWTPYVDLFRDDPHSGARCFVDHHGMGRFEGRDGIREYILGAMRPYPRMTFPIDWVALDPDHGAIVFQVQNAFPAPPYQDEATKTPFQFPNWTRLVYLGEGKFLSEEDVYNPARDAQRVVKAWRAAGGKFESPEVIKYKFSAKSPSATKL